MPDGATYYYGAIADYQDNVLESDEDNNVSEALPLLVRAPNLPPEAVDDVFSSLEDMLLSGDVLVDNGRGADYDPNADALNVRLVDGPNHGNLVLDETGAFSYTPDADFNGQDWFTYEVSDPDGLTDQAFVTLTVAAVNDTPQIAAPGEQTTPEDVALTISGLAVGDVDVAEGTGELAVTLSVLHGTVTVAPDVPGGLTSAQIDTDGVGCVVLTGTPAAINATLASGVTYLSQLDFTGLDTLTVAANDLGNTGIGGSQTATVSVPIHVLSPTEQVSNLNDTIDNLADRGVLSTGQAKSLARKLGLDGPRVAVEHRIGAFIRHVRALVAGDILTEDEGEELIDAVMDLLASLTI